MPAFDDAIQGLGKGGSSALHRGWRLKEEQPSPPGQRRRVAPLRPPSPVTDLHHRRIKRKRSHDRLADDNNSASKKRRRDDHHQSQPGLGAETIDLSGDEPPVILSSGSARIIQDTTPMDLTRDSAEPPSGPNRRVQSSSAVGSLDTSPREAGHQPRDVKPLIPSTPTRGGAKEEKKHEVIVLSDSDGDDSEKKNPAAPPSTPVRRKSVQSGSTVESAFGLVTPGTPSTPRLVAQPRRRRPEHTSPGQARPANSAAEKGGAMSSLTPAHIRMRQPFEMAFQPGPPTAGSPSPASKVLRSPFMRSPAHEATNAIIFAKTSSPAARERDANQDQLRRGSGPVLRLVKREPDTGAQEEAADETKPEEENTTEEGEADSASSIESNTTAPKETGSLPQPRRVCIVVLKVSPNKLRRIHKRRAQDPELPIDNKCFLLNMSTEVQNSIFQYLLLAADPIRLLHQWSQLHKLQRSGLHPEILLTCKTMFKNGSAFLYGENVFRYLVRDRFQSGAAMLSSSSSSASLLLEEDQDIYVEKYMPLFRRLELQIERSRTENAYCSSMANAIDMLNDHVADLQTLAIDVSPRVEGDTLSVVGYFFKNGQIMQALKALKTRFIVLRVFTPKTGEEPAVNLRRTYDMRAERGVLDKNPMKPPADKLEDICDMITRACESPSAVVEEGLFEKFEVVQRQDKRPAILPTITYDYANDDDDDYVATESDSSDGSDDEYRDDECHD